MRSSRDQLGVIVWAQVKSTFQAWHVQITNGNDEELTHEIYTYLMEHYDTIQARHDPSLSSWKSYLRLTVHRRLLADVRTDQRRGQRMGGGTRWANKSDDGGPKRPEARRDIDRAKRANEMPEPKTLPSKVEDALRSAWLEEPLELTGENIDRFLAGEADEANQAKIQKWLYSGPTAKAYFHIEAGVTEEDLDRLRTRGNGEVSFSKRASPP